VRHGSRGQKLGTAALLLLAIAVVGAAVADSIGKSLSHGHSSEQKQTTPVVRGVVVPGRAQLAASLRRSNVEGVLYFVDRSCRLHGLRLPGLTTAPAPRGGGCRALVSPASAPPGWSLWPRKTPLVARCEHRRVIVSATAGLALPMIGGCAPAWRPDGSMTYIRRGAIVQFPRTGRAQVLRSREQLVRALELAPVLKGSTGWRASRVAWLGPGRFAVVASAGPRTILAVFSGRRIVSIRTHIPDSVTELRASPRGDYLVLRTPGGLRVYDGRRNTLPRVLRFGTPRAIAWSGDEDWVGLASKGRVVLQGSRRQVVLPFDAIDLAWTRPLT
jgi:hypothetical protein